MIIVKHLTVEGFRLLRRIEVHFPQRGSVLISGPNEAGKSALLESVYFALYGESFASDGILIGYGESRASVTLTLSIGVTELTIVRRIERGGGQDVSVSVRRLGMPEEGPITRLSEANARIIAELGGMDGETLRNSCLIEQGGLSRLEYLGASRREATLRRLLDGAEQLVRLREQCTLTEQDEQLLGECRWQLRLAEVQARLPELSKQLGEIEAALDAVRVSEELAEIDAREAEIAEQASEAAGREIRRDEIKGRQVRVAQLKRAEALLGEISGAYDGLAEAQRELPVLGHELAELERRERDELPGLEQRVHDLSDLTRSFGTLERMAGDLLAAVNTIKTLESELKEQQAVREDLAELDEQVIAARLQVEAAREAQYEVEERDRAARPQLEARLRRLQALAERLRALVEREERTLRHRVQEGLAEENSAQLKEVQRALHEGETELAGCEDEARQRELEADALEERWRQVSIGRQLEEWRRLKGLAEAEQQVLAAHRQQEQLTLLVLSARRDVTRNMGMAIACVTLFLVCGGAALLFALHSAYVYATAAGLASLLLAAGTGVSLRNYGRSREEEKAADAQMQDAIGRVGMMVAAREAASRVADGSAGGGGGGNADPSPGQAQGTVPTRMTGLAEVEHELRSLGGTIPRSLDEAGEMLRYVADKSAAGESLADMRQRMTECRDRALAARKQVNVTTEAVAALRKECARLEGQREQEGWDMLAERLLADRMAIESMRAEIAAMAGQEGLPIPNFGEDRYEAQDGHKAPSPQQEDGEGRHEAEILRSAQDDKIREDGKAWEDDKAWEGDRADEDERFDEVGQFKAQVEEAIRATEREIALLDGKRDLLPDLAAQVDVRQATLNALLIRKQTLGARLVVPREVQEEQVEQARRQQVTLRDGLRALQDALRERVQKLGVSFGQAAISAAEGAARRQLESLQTMLGERVELERRHTSYAERLEGCQEVLSEQYAQLAKLSGTLGSWIVPPSPFAEDLAALRARCQTEIREANEQAMVQQLEALAIEEGASQAKIALCRAEIVAAQERIATQLAQRNRPVPKGYGRSDVVAVWPLVGEYGPQDRERLRGEAEAIEQELHELEEQEMALGGEALQAGGGTHIDLEQARKRVEQQERVYETKKRGGLLVQAAQERLIQKMLPRTEYYMQQLLPLLTRGRFHDARLTTVGGDDETVPADGAWQLSVWEPQAFEYIPRGALSAGMADVLSLSLRLAFAIAALPRELSVAPGFLLLDEPLGASDAERARALVELVTGPLLSSHFEQIVLVSHGAWDPGLFDYYVAIDAGEVVASNLPVGQAQDTVPTVAVPSQVANAMPVL